MDEISDLQCSLMNINSTSINGILAVIKKFDLELIFSLLIDCSIFRPLFIDLYVIILENILDNDESKSLFIKSILFFLNRRATIPRRPAFMSLLFKTVNKGIIDYKLVEDLALNYTLNNKYKITIEIYLFIWFMVESSDNLKKIISKITSDKELMSTQHPSIQNFFYNHSNLSANNFRLYNLIRESSSELKTIEAILKRDDIDLLKKIIDKLQKDGKIQQSVFELSFICNNNPCYVSYCAYYGSIKCLKLLMENSFNVDENIKEFASAGGHKEIIDLFCRDERILSEHHHSYSDIIGSAKGCNIKGLLNSINCFNINQVDEKGRTSLMYTSMFSPWALEAIITNYKNIEINVTDKEGYTALSYASINGFKNSVQALLNLGCDPNIKHRYGMTPLHWASQCSYPEIAKLLLDSGANILLDDEEWNPLHWAAFSNCTEIIILLKDINIESKQKDRMTPLHIASMNGCLEACHTLIDSGANINARDRSKLTPLMWATQNFKPEVIHFFLTRCPNLDINLTDDQGACFLHWAVQIENDIMTPLIEIAVEQMHAKLDVFDSTKSTPFHCAVGLGNIPSVIIFLENGVDPNVLMYDGISPLHNAVREKNIELVSILLEFKSDPNIREKQENLTPLHFAASNNFPEAVSLLLAYGADKNITDNSGYTPLKIAQMFNFSNIINLLNK